MKLGIIVRADETGLGYQTRNLTYMLKPDRIMVIDSSYFNKGAEQHFEWYDGFRGFVSNGFPSNQEVQLFANGLTHIITCEIPYNYHLFTYAKTRGIKTYLQFNYEFFDELKNKFPKPYKYVAPSRWHEEDLQKYNPTYLPPPTFASDFKQARDMNMQRTGHRRFLHVMGRQAARDRNGTNDLIRAIKLCKEDFELVISVQQKTEEIEQNNDKRITIREASIKNQEDLYKGFDAMIMPRRYGGLCLPMNEALLSGLPVIMTDISPNNKVLNNEWLVESSVKETFQTRTIIDCYEADTNKLAQKIDWLASISHDELTSIKASALDIGLEKFSADSLKPKYTELLSE